MKKRKLHLNVVIVVAATLMLTTASLYADVDMMKYAPPWQTTSVGIAAGKDYVSLTADGVVGNYVFCAKPGGGVDVIRNFAGGGGDFFVDILPGTYVSLTADCQTMYTCPMQKLICGQRF